MSNFTRLIMDMFEEEEELMMNTAVIAVHQLFQRSHENDETNRGGSVMNHRVLDRNRFEGYERLYRDYFSKNPTFLETFFRRRFRMRGSLFLRIQRAMEEHDRYFVQRTNAVEVCGLSSLQQITVAMRMLVYETPANDVDEYVRISESTTIKSLRRFVKGVVEVFGNEYLRRHIDTDVVRLLAISEERGFPGMLGSIDCMHWKWKNCPTAWHGTYTGHIREPTIILEAITSYDLLIWHAFLGLLGSLDDINVLYRSHVFAELAEGRGLEVRYTINGRNYNMGYYHVDGIYPSWSTFVKTIQSPQGNKKKLFAITQESVRKDVERAFGVLQAQFAIVRGLSQHERDIRRPDYSYDEVDGTPTIALSRARTIEFLEFVQIHKEIRGKSTHFQLQNDLIEQIWERYGSS
ncbi:hypothetical protein M5689_003483 [Euphorbia peplus]|nr:hypothetical protein M5689_003483 [Euphorbia peplus]